MGQFQKLALALYENPQLCTLLGVPAGVVASLPQLGELADQIIGTRQSGERRGFRRALVLELMQGH